MLRDLCPLIVLEKPVVLEDAIECHAVAEVEARLCA
jgi:hypothetical protein